MFETVPRAHDVDRDDAARLVARARKVLANGSTHWMDSSAGRPARFGRARRFPWANSRGGDRIAPGRRAGASLDCRRGSMRVVDQDPLRRHRAGRHLDFARPPRRKDRLPRAARRRSSIVRALISARARRWSCRRILSRSVHGDFEQAWRFLVDFVSAGATAETTNSCRLEQLGFAISKETRASEGRLNRLLCLQSPLRVSSNL
jgi:hypothetical protein